MTEVLYCPINDELLLFTGACELDLKRNTMILYIHTSRKGMKKIEAGELVHIGWL